MFIKRHAIAIELKYPTRKLNIDLGGEGYQLADGAADYTLYDYIKDIERLEQITSVYSNAIGYAVMLTNDRADLDAFAQLYRGGLPAARRPAGKGQRRLGRNSRPRLHQRLRARNHPRRQLSRHLA